MEIAKKIICRACALPKNAQFAAYWQPLKALISDSSKTLKEKIRDIDPLALDKLDRRTRISIERYFNRARFRPIPYGQFATVGLLPTSDTGGTATLSTLLELLNLKDWSEAKQPIRNDNTWPDGLLWRVQATLYSCAGIHYFLQSTEGQTELFSLSGFEELDKLLHFCREPRSTKELKQLAGSDWTFYRDIIMQLLELQVLTNSLQANLTGDDYFERIGESTRQRENSPYTIAFRHGHQGFSNKHLEKELTSYVAFAQKLLPNPDRSSLSEFRKQFTKRYENQWQPLSLVLDPDQGIGYAGLSNAGSQDIASILPKPAAHLKEIMLDPLARFMLKGMIGGETIDLKEFRDGDVKQTNLPNTLNILLQQTTSGEWALDYIGGPSATTLLGRFAKDPQIFSFANELASLERDANPSVKFFDIAYQTGERTDNINRRPQFYELELVLGGWSTHPEQLQLSDLFINVIGEELVLYSAKYQCRVVPRMASAYNILRSSNPLLRLLADLQYQGLQLQYLPDLGQVFPDMDYYPQLKFGKLLLQPAKWKVPSLAKSSAVAMDQWLKDQNVNRFVKVGHADQYLCLDLQQSMDRELLWDCLQRDPSLDYLSEWPAGGEQGIADQAGNRFAYQLQLVLTHQKEIYLPVFSFEKPLTHTNWPVGGDWLYLSLYTSPQHQPSVLTELIEPLLSKHIHLIDNWFYILYGDPDRHIRLRIKWRKETSAEMRCSLAAEMGSWLGQNGIKDTVIRAYTPEWQRYGRETMKLAEMFFGLDSSTALPEMVMPEDQRVAQCYGWIWGMITYALPDKERRKLFTERMASMFAEEMAWGKEVFKVLNQAWRAMPLPLMQTFPKTEMLHLWKEICSRSNRVKQEQLLADFIHMHINRRFPEHARVREAQLYQYVLLYQNRHSKLAAKERLTVR